MTLKVGNRVILNGKRNHSYNGRRATIVSIDTRKDGKVMVRVEEIEGLHPKTSRLYFDDQVKS